MFFWVKFDDRDKVLSPYLKDLTSSVRFEEFSTRIHSCSSWISLPIWISTDQRAMYLHRQDLSVIYD